MTASAPKSEVTTVGRPAFDAVAERLRASVRAYVARQIPVGDVDDIVQETLLDIWRTSCVDQPRSYESLAIHVASRRVADYWRRSGREGDRCARVARLTPPRGAPDPASVVEHRQPPPWLDELPADAIDLLLLVVDGYRVSEIAEHLGLSPNAVSSRLKRIRDRVPHLIGRHHDTH